MNREKDTQSHWLPEPTPAADVGYDTRGFDCLVAVIRRIYHLVADDLDGTKAFAEAQEKNLILRYACGVPDLSDVATPDLVASSVAEKKKIMTKLFGNDPRASINFHDLCCSDLMNETFWRLRPFHLFRPRLENFEGSSPPWRWIDWDPREITAMNLIRMEGSQNPASTLQDFVNGTFGRRTWRGREVLLASNCPTVVRVLYTPGPDRVDSFQELRSFNMPYYNFENGWQVSGQGHMRYSLVAVVHMVHPDVVAFQDSVRLYGLDGSQLVPRSSNPAFTDYSWSLDQFTDSSYMLFFGKADEVQLEPGFPEVTPVKTPVTGNELIMDVLKSYRDSR
ncbi:hypothetical protein QQZ08_007256 [Neonectria magnoliae]|uniref:Uncharacterized protein n=1 Tax=Neonectria magnoliae TaxID=2732573 RepID=A0ABR1HZK8_9HYPO